MNLFTQPSGKLKKFYLAALLLSLTAAAVTILLIMAHCEVSSTGSFCNINDYWNCDRVNKSVFAEILGIPVAILGLFYYLFMSLVFFGLWKGYDFPKIVRPFSTTLLLRVAALVSGASMLLMTAMEYPLLGNLFPVAVIKALLIVLLYICIYRVSRRAGSAHTDTVGTVAILSLFGAGFSLYLTDIELFVLHAICVYCFTQQILIVIIFVLSLIALKTSLHEHIKPKNTDR